jgi:hypothetical protein
LSDGKKSVWEVQLDHELFALCSLDITGDGCEEIVACALDGMTYIVDQDQNFVKFKFEDRVFAFCAGMNTFITYHS